MSIQHEYWTFKWQNPIDKKVLNPYFFKLLFLKNFFPDEMGNENNNKKFKKS